MSKNEINKFESVTDVRDAKRYDGFIDPEGNFWKVSTKNHHSPTHIEWADAYVTKNLDYIKLLANPTGSFLFTVSKLKNKQDILIHFYGYVYYGHDAYDRKPIIKYPDKMINDVTTTSKQLDFLFKLLRENNELEYIIFGNSEKVEEDRHERYVDSFIDRVNNRKDK